MPCVYEWKRLVAACVALRLVRAALNCGFEAYVEAAAASLAHADRATPFRPYCAGLILPDDPKRVDPMAARVEPGLAQTVRQSLHHVVPKAEWLDQAALASIHDQVLPKIVQSRATLVWIIDDTGFPKKG